MVTAKSPFGCSTSSTLRYSRGVAQIGERVLVAALALDRRRIGVERPRLADEVERDVRERDVLLEHRRVAAPFGQTMPEHERIVGEAQRVLHERRVGGRDGGHHMCPTSSGTS